MLTTISSREFDQHPSLTQKQAETAPVFITKRGQTAHVLPSCADCQRLAGKTANALEALISSDSPDVSETGLFIHPRSKARHLPADFSEE